MSKLVWDQDGERFYETGIDHCALYVYDTYTKGQSTITGYKPGVAWNGVTSISETPEGGEANDLYADNIKYLSLMSAENLNISIEAYTYPDEFMECDGTYQPTDGMRVYQQRRKKFGLAYRTRVGNDVAGDSLGYQIHLIYNCLASPSDRQYSTVSDSPEAITFSWEGTTTPVEVGSLGPQDAKVEYRPTSRIIVDSRDFNNETKKGYLTAFENYLFGTDAADAMLPTPAEVYSLLTTGALPQN